MLCLAQTEACVCASVCVSGRDALRGTVRGGGRRYSHGTHKCMWVCACVGEGSTVWEELTGTKK